MIDISECTELQKQKTTLKATSKDKENKKYMVSFGTEVIDFDKVKIRYTQKYHQLFPGEPVPEIKSNDALCCTKDNKLAFIEFKNGKIESKTIKETTEKAYDSTF